MPRFSLFLALGALLFGACSGSEPLFGPADGTEAVARLQDGVEQGSNNGVGSRRSQLTLQNGVEQGSNNGVEQGSDN